MVPPDTPPRILGEYMAVTDLVGLHDLTSSARPCAEPPGLQESCRGAGGWKQRLCMAHAWQSGGHASAGWQGEGPTLWRCIGGPLGKVMGHSLG